MNDFDKLEHELKSMGELQIETPDMNREIEKMINKRIRNICLKTIGAVAIVLALIFVCISPVMKSIYLNPVKIEKDNNSFTNYLRTYYETIQPYVEIGQTQIKDKGFGNYDIGIDANEFTGANGISINASKNPEIIMEFKQNKGMITLDSTRALGYTVDRFKCYWNEKNKILEEIKKLPSSSYITMSLGTTQVRSVTELMKEDIHPEWVEIYNPESKFQGGLNLNFKIMKKDTDERNHMTEQELSNVFKDNLELLLSKPKLLQSLGINSFYTLDEIQETRNIFENKNSLTTKNYCISGTKEQIINYLEKTETVSIYVDNIKLSTLGI